MNIQTQVGRAAGRQPLKVNAEQFWLLKQAGVFAGYTKSELIEGEISGCPVQADDEPEWDGSVPIKLRVQDYLMLDEAGLLPGRTELIDGLLYAMSPQHRAHWYAKNELTYRLRRALEDIASDLYVGSEGSVSVSEVDLPEPDIIVTSEPMGVGPIPLGSVRLLVEIADSTQVGDAGRKAALYAQFGVPEYWLVDVTARLIHQMWGPQGDDYVERCDLTFNQRLSATTVDRLVIETTGLAG